jgi:hypothetical protein
MASNAVVALGSSIDQRSEAQEMNRILDLQNLEVSEEENDFFGNSCTSSLSHCCSG